MSLVNAVCSREWAIEPQMLRVILEIAARERSENIIDALQKRDAQKLANTRAVQMRDDVAIISVHGPVFKYGNLFTEISGATSLAMLMKDFNAALENSDVKHIVLDIDSPGGEVNGVNEFANAIYNARDQKNIVAYVGGTGASAAYWIASSASKVYMDATAMVGSIGVVATYIDDKERLAKNGVKEIEIVSASSPKKRPDLSTEDGRAVIQARVDRLQDIFVATVARNRGVTAENVLESYGKGDVLIGKDAVAVGMADKISSLENVIASLTQKTEVEKMSDQNNEKLYTAEEITAENLLAEFPDVAKELMAKGAESERYRIQGIYAMIRPGIEDVIEKAMFEQTAQAAGDVAIEIVKRHDARKQTIAKNLAEDAEEIPNLAAKAPATDDADAAAQKAIDEAVVAGLNGKVK